MPGILAWDESLNLAYSATNPNGGDAPITALHRLPTDGENFGPALARAEQVVTDAIAVHRPDEVWFESPMLVRGSNITTTAQTIRLLFGLCSIIELAAYKAEIPVFEANNMSWKKFFVGNGHAKKRDTIERCIALGWGKPGLDNNCADSMGIYAFGRACSDESFSARIMPLFGETA